MAVIPKMRVSLLSLALTFLRLGATTWGGMWVATSKLEAELVHRRGWLRPEDLIIMFVAATLMPAPKFMALAGLVGYRLRGWLGSVVAACCLLAPGSLLLLLGVVAISPEALSGPLAPVRRAVGVAVVGLLLGTARRQIQGAGLTGRDRWVAAGLGLVVTAVIIAGVPMLVAAPAGFVLGALLVRGGEPI